MNTTARVEREAERRVERRRASFEALARRFYAGVYSYLCWISRDAGLAEDLTQEAFMQIWQHPPEFRGDRALKAWVYRIARNQYLQHRRRAGRDTVALDECAEFEPADAARNPQAALERDQLRGAVREALGKLPDGYREVIVLHNLEGLSLAQVAAVLEIPKGTVKSRRAKAFAMLRHLLHQQEVETNEV